MKSKIKIAQGGRGAMELLPKGEVDIGLTFISEMHLKLLGLFAPVLDSIC
jgi:hypothetical protein